MALDIEVVVDGGVGCKEPLRRPWRSEAQALSLAAPGRLVRNLCPVVRPPDCDMAIGQAERAESCAVGSKPIGDDSVGHVFLALQQSSQELQRRLPVPPWLHDDVEHFALIVHGAPEIIAASPGIRSENRPGNPPREWPWHSNWWKPKDRRRDLVRAAALIVAEIERLDRASANAPRTKTVK